MVPLREMEHIAEGERLGTGIRTCHVSTAIWETDWELVVAQSGLGPVLFCPVFICGRRTCVQVSAWLGYASLVGRGCAAELQQTVNTS